MRPDQTDPGMNDTMTPRPVRADTAEDTAAMRRRERAGSPSPAELDGTSWQDIKSRFVDDPKGAIAAAEELVRRALDQRVRTLKDEAEALCTQGSDDESSSTENMRTRLIRYQEYCERKNGA